MSTKTRYLISIIWLIRVWKCIYELQLSTSYFLLLHGTRLRRRSYTLPCALKLCCQGDLERNRSAIQWFAAVLPQLIQFLCLLVSFPSLSEFPFCESPAGTSKGWRGMREYRSRARIEQEEEIRIRRERDIPFYQKQRLYRFSHTNHPWFYSIW